MSRPLLLLVLLVAPGFASAADRPDVLIADFEGDTYGDGWTTTGTAFGKGPAKGTLPNQMAVSGFLGKGLVNSYLGGDASTGTLTSPEFKVERKYINFLVGGGKHPGKTCVDLLVGGKVVRTATGPNDKPGGSEHLDWHSWDVAEFEGKAAVLRIVDEERGGWGHINADHIVQSDTKKQAEPASRTLAVDQPYLHLPVKNGAPMRRVKFTVGGETVREFDIELAVDGRPDFWVFAEVAVFKGKTLTVETVLPSGSKALDALTLSRDVPDPVGVYREPLRPLFHFTSRRGWLNDPNGLVYHDGRWHLFYQHNPFGTKWGNMHWGHAASSDLVHWQELGVALHPRAYGDWAFSGSAVVDVANTSGWGKDGKPPLVLAYTSTGRGECVAYSTDGGRTWTEYEKNPVVKHAGRDPKLVWYEPGKHWVMAVYDEFEKKQWIAFYTSPDLKAWTFASRIEGFYECPDLFELPVDGDPKRTKWVLYGADGKYLLGGFDGKRFEPDGKEKLQVWYGNFYAAQTFANTTRSRGGILTATGSHPKRECRVQVGWARGVTFPGMPFDQQMTVPVDLSLRQTADGVRLTAEPVEELGRLQDKLAFHAALTGYRAASPGKDVRVELATGLDAFDVEAVVRCEGVAEVGLDVRGTRVSYDVAKGLLTCKGVTAPLKVERDRANGRVLPLSLRILVDRGSVEVFANDGRVAMSVAVLHDPKDTAVSLYSRGADRLEVVNLAVRSMKSTW